MTPPGLQKRSAGVTVIEILVGMVVSLIILGAIVTVMSNTRTNQEISQMKSALQENGRFAIHFLSEDLLNAGFFGCSNDLVGGTATAAVASTDGTSGATDSITITYGEPDDAGVTTATNIPANIGGSNYSITLSVADSYCSNTPCDLADVDSEWGSTTQAVISNCSGAAVVTISNVDTAANTLQIASSSSMGIFFEAGASIKRLVSAAYTLATGPSGVLSLYRNGLEIVEGVENTQFLYRTNAGSQATMPAWSALQAVQIGILARTVSNENLDLGTSREYGIDIDSGNYNVLGETVSAGSIQGSRHTYASLVTRRNN